MCCGHVGRGETTGCICSQGLSGERSQKRSSRESGRSEVEGNGEGGCNTMVIWAWGDDLFDKRP